MKILTLLLPLIFALSCTSSNNDGDNGAGAAAVSPPPATATPTPMPSPGKVWGRVYNEFFNDMIIPENCPFTWKFLVRNDAAFEAGPCESGDEKIRGSLTVEEFNEYNRRAQSVVDSDPTKPSDCTNGGAITGEFLDLRIGTKDYRIFSTTPIETCYRGEKSRVDSLREYNGELRTKYYPNRNLGE